MQLGRHGHPGFTIVELLVSMALMIFIMTIMAEAFSAALDSFRQLKTAGDMQDRLRGAVAILKRDLMATHFTPAAKGRLSNWDLSTGNPPDPVNNNEGGFFRIWQGSTVSPTGPYYVWEGQDADGLNAFRAVDHILHFTVALPLPQSGSSGHRREDYFTALIPSGSPLQSLQPPGTAQYSPDDNPVDFRQAGTYNSHWAEVAYFMRAEVDASNNPIVAGATTPSPTPLYTLYRRQRVVVPNFNPDAQTLNTPINPPIANRITDTSPPTQYYEMSTTSAPPSNNQVPLYFNSPQDLAIPERRLGANPTAGSAGYPGNISYWNYPTLADSLGGSASQAADDVLLTDVISFQVQIQSDTGGYGTDFTDIHPVNAANNPVLAGKQVFDTWAAGDLSGTYAGYSGWNTPGTAYSIPNKIHVKGIQVIFRIWDAKSQQTRQITLIQDM